MRKVVFLLVALLLIVPASFAKKKPKIKMDPRILSAQFVRVVSATGGPYEAGTQYGDRSAINAVQSALEKWGRFRVVYTNQPADIIIVVRQGRIGSATVGGNIPVGGGPDPMPGGGGRVGVGSGIPSIGVGGEVASTPDDSFVVYDGKNGFNDPQNLGDTLANSPALWRASMENGLFGKAPLVEEFKKEIEAAEKELADQKADKNKKP